jgi:hypothetical protein
MRAEEGRGGQRRRECGSQPLAAATLPDVIMATGVLGDQEVDREEGSQDPQQKKADKDSPLKAGGSVPHSYKVP